MEQALDDQYCVGLWKKNLVTQLFWISRCCEQRLHPRPKPSRAPTWSWASLDGRISASEERSYTEVKALINVTDCKVESTADDATSLVTGGILRLSGWLASVQLRPESQDKWAVFFNGAWGQEPSSRGLTANLHPFSFTAYHFSLIFRFTTSGIIETYVAYSSAQQEM